MVQGAPVEVETLFLHYSKKLRERRGTKFITAICCLSKFLPEKLFNFIAKFFKPLRQLLMADVILDICGGDSFTTIYGTNVFLAQAEFKRIAFLLNKPLILLPQTFGPFEGQLVCNTVINIFKKCCSVTTRDSGGLGEIQKIIGNDLGDRFTQCPDVAFTLEPITVPLENDSFFPPMSSLPVIGLNVSGLLYLNRKDFGIKVDYKGLILGIIDWVIKELHGKVLLVPHVVTTRKMAAEGTSMEYTDYHACEKILSEIKDMGHNEECVDMIKGAYSPGEIKYLIGKCNFFIGSRMHACIAATSQKVPTVALAYSKKFAGVFGLAGIPDVVIDLRYQTTESCLKDINERYHRREVNQSHFSSQIYLAQRNVEEYFSKTLRKHLEAKLTSTSICKKITS